MRVGMEATGHARWFERLLAELGFELWIGDPAEIKAKRVRKKKTDREDARLMLKLLLENRFPRIWVPSPENRDLRQLLWQDCGVNGGSRARSQETARGGAADDTSWRGTHHGTGLRSGHRDARAVSLRQADRQLHGAHSVRGLQCRQAATGTHQQAGQYSAALFAGGSIASSRTVQPRLATSVCTLDDAPGKKNCQSSHGQKTRCTVVLVEFGSNAGKLGYVHGVQ